MNKSILLALALLFFRATDLAAQIPQQQVEQARADLQKRGIDDKEVEKRLRARGFDPSNVRPDQLAEIQRATQEIIAELEAEKAAAQPKMKSSGSVLQPATTQNPSSNLPEKQANEADLKEKVEKTVKKTEAKIKEGVAADEAVTEATQATTAENLPTSKIFGQAIFRQRKLEVYRQTNEINTPDGYELGPGDKLAISIWGLAVFNQRLVK